MEEALENVVQKFDHTEEGLIRIENKLQSDISDHLNNVATGDDDKVSLLHKLDEIKQDYAVIKKEALELGQLQREMALAFQQQLQETVQKLQALTEKEASGHNSSEAAATAVNSLLTQSAVAETLTDKLKSHQT